jgi:hypothetical protein
MKVPYSNSSNVATILETSMTTEDSLDTGSDSDTEFDLDAEFPPASDYGSDLDADFDLDLPSEKQSESRITEDSQDKHRIQTPPSTSDDEIEEIMRRCEDKYTGSDDDEEIDEEEMEAIMRRYEDKYTEPEKK